MAASAAKSVFLTSKTRKASTLVLLVQEGRLLLGMKKRGFGVGKWNGFGGKVESGETVREGALREMREECGVDIPSSALTEAGVLAFDFPDGSCGPLLVHVFKASGYTGKIEESEEMAPRWFETNSIPFDQMWQEDEHWFPLFLSDTRCTATFQFESLLRMVAHQVTPVSPPDKPWDTVLAEFLAGLTSDPQ